MAKPSKQVLTQIQNGKAVVASATTHAGAIAAEAAKFITDRSPEEIEAAISAWASYLSRATTTLSEAEDHYVAEQADDVPIRDARDLAAAALLALMVFVRGRVEQLFGASGLKRYGMEGETPRYPKALAAHVDSSIKLLREDAQEKTDPMGAKVSTLEMADSLALLLAPLQTHLDALVREARENEAALTARDRATTLWQRAYRSAGMALVGYYRAAGRDDLADRILPTVRRETGVEDTPPDPEQPGPAV